ncbi:hypothetical protein MED217_17195 [Leeuwenhoekiella blandensis MED217]|uniref:RiboL-PSP-HEPN domain-containing protein n=2 Tax=Leeuwenhoekiella TaxID=283735 RepID=A3XHE5_LEEBM|nr:hypothetical protein MED217_17195 [Leeuwenhoekiella blandensis MED217]
MPKKEEEFSFKESNDKIGEIIACSIYIEDLISEVITNYFNPQKKEEFQHILMNSSVVSYGQKLKILSNIENFDSKIINKLRTIGSLRNSVAHNNLILKFDSTSSFSTISELHNNITLSVMNSSGKLVDKNLKDIFEEFNTLCKEICYYFQEEFDLF